MFEYLAKGAKQREQAIAGDQVCAAVRSLRRRRGGGDQLLAYRVGSRWHDVTAALGELGRGCDFGDLATSGRAEQAVLDLLASD